MIKLVLGLLPVVVTETMEKICHIIPVKLIGQEGVLDGIIVVILDVTVKMVVLQMEHLVLEVEEVH